MGKELLRMKQVKMWGDKLQFFIKARRKVILLQLQEPKLAV